MFQHTGGREEQNNLGEPNKFFQFSETHGFLNIDCIKESQRVMKFKSSIKEFSNARYRWKRHLYCHGRLKTSSHMLIYTTDAIAFQSRDDKK